MTALIFAAAAVISLTPSGEGVWRSRDPDVAVSGVSIPASKREPLYAAAGRLQPILKELLPAGLGFDCVPQRSIWSSKDLDSQVPSIGMNVRMFNYHEGKPSEEGISIQVYSNNVRCILGFPKYNGIKNGVRLWTLPKQLGVTHGLPVFDGGHGRAVILVTRTGLDPFMPVTRKRTAEYARRIIENKAKDKNQMVADWYKKSLARLDQEVANMSPEELARPAYYREAESFLDWRGFQTSEKDSDGSATVPVVELNSELFISPPPETKFRSLAIVLPLRTLGMGPEIQHCLHQIDAFDWTLFRKLLDR